VLPLLTTNPQRDTPKQIRPVERERSHDNFNHSGPDAGTGNAEHSERSLDQEKTADQGKEERDTCKHSDHRDLYRARLEPALTNGRRLIAPRRSAVRVRLARSRFYSAATGNRSSANRSCTRRTIATFDLRSYRSSAWVSEAAARAPRPDAARTSARSQSASPW